MKKRYFTLTAGIIGTATLGITSMLFLMAMFFAIINEQNDSYSTLAIICVLLVFSIIGLVLNACSISAYSNSAEKYKVKKLLLITSVVFNFGHIVIFALATLSNAIFLLFLLALVAANVFYILDLVRESKPINEDIGYSELEKLAKFREDGLISDKEFETLKAQTLTKYMK